MKKKTEKMPVAKKTIVDRVKSLVSSTLAIFSVIMMILYIVGSATADWDFGPNIYIMWLMLGVSVSLALAEKFYASYKNFAIKLVGHFVISLAGVYLILSLGVQHIAKDSTNARAVGGVFLFIILYVIIMGTRIGIRSFINRRRENDEEYESVFEKDSKRK